MGCQHRPSLHPTLLGMLVSVKLNKDPLMILLRLKSGWIVSSYERKCPLAETWCTLPAPTGSPDQMNLFVYTHLVTSRVQATLVSKISLGKDLTWNSAS